jgi:hypothetical protein
MRHLTLFSQETKAMKKLLALSLTISISLTLFAAPLHAITRFYQATIALSTTNTNQTFTDNRSGGTTGRFLAKEITVVNTSAIVVYADPTDGVATSADIPIAATGEEGSTVVFKYKGTGDGFASIGLLAASGTPSVRVTAVP